MGSEGAPDTKGDPHKENKELSKKVSKQRERIIELLTEAEHLKGQKTEVKALKLDEKRLRKRLKKKSKTW